MPRRGSCDDVSDSEHQDFKPHPRICQIGWNFQCCHSSVNELKLPVTLARSYGQDRFPEQPSHAARVRARCAASAGHAVPCTSLARAQWHFTYNPGPCQCRTLQVSSLTTGQSGGENSRRRLHSLEAEEHGALESSVRSLII